MATRITPPRSTRSPSAAGAHTGKPAITERVGPDRHTRERKLAVKADDGTISNRRIATSRERFTAVLGGRPRAEMLLEASTERVWVARQLESLGHEVIEVAVRCLADGGGGA